jgi:hypothetical protein
MASSTKNSKTLTGSNDPPMCDADEAFDAEDNAASSEGQVPQPSSPPDNPQGGAGIRPDGTIDDRGWP